MTSVHILFPIRGNLEGIHVPTLLDLLYSRSRQKRLGVFAAWQGRHVDESHFVMGWYPVNSGRFWIEGTCFLPEARVGKKVALYFHRYRPYRGRDAKCVSCHRSEGVVIERALRDRMNRTLKEG